MLDKTHPGTTLCRKVVKSCDTCTVTQHCATRKDERPEIQILGKKHLNCKICKLRLLVNSFLQSLQSWYHPSPWTLSLDQAAPDTLVASDDMLYSPSELKGWNPPHKNVTGLFLTSFEGSTALVQCSFQRSLQSWPVQCSSGEDGSIAKSDLFLVGKWHVQNTQTSKLKHIWDVIRNHC